MLLKWMVSFVLSILHNGDESVFPDDEFHFADSRLNGPVLDSQGLRIEMECSAFQACHPCNGCLPRSVMPPNALATKHRCGRPPEEFPDLTWIDGFEIILPNSCPTRTSASWFRGRVGPGRHSGRSAMYSFRKSTSERLSRYNQRAPKRWYRAVSAL